MHTYIHTYIHVYTGSCMRKYHEDVTVVCEQEPYERPWKYKHIHEGYVHTYIHTYICLGAVACEKIMKMLRWRVSKSYGLDMQVFMCHTLVAFEVHMYVCMHISMHACTYHVYADANCMCL